MVLRLVLVILFFAAGYQRATWFRTRYGRTPWGWHPLVWGLVCFFSLLLGIVLLAVAERSGRSRAQHPVHGRPPMPVANYWGHPPAPVPAHPGNPAGPGANYWGNPAAPSGQPPVGGYQGQQYWGPPSH